jgi:formylglycine-generating enzyme required for sulfatase activity
MVTRSGQVKVLDFGLAKVVSVAGGSGLATEATMTRDAKTRAGIVLGTPAYMSPEQARGEAVDARSDVFSCGAMLYEMLAGRRPFHGDSVTELLSSILRDDPPPLAGVRPGVPPDLDAVVMRCLARDKEARYASGGELVDALVRCQARLSGAIQRPPASGRRLVWIGVALSGVVAAAFLGRMGLRASREREARRVTLPEIERLVQSDQGYAAYRLARRSEALLAGDPAFDRLWRELCVFTNVQTQPEGASVEIKPYLQPDLEWENLGQSPLQQARLPFAYVRVRVSKPGYQTFEGAVMTPSMVLRGAVLLEAAGAAPAGTVRVPPGTFQYGAMEPVQLEGFWMDRFEVTNRQFKVFVDQGGYRERRFWKQPFVRDDRTLGWDDSMALLRDTTGRPGPAGWELGSYPAGQEDYPVTGVSWYEAAAYGEFAGKSLPTFYHWYRAAELGISSEILLLSNFGGEGPAPVGRHQGIGPFGTFDQAGNVREWVWNARDDRRYTLGGAWGDPTYLYSGPESAGPWDRLPTVGFRTARYEKAPPPATLEPVETWTFMRDYARERPVGDDVFQAYRVLYAYEKTPLEARVESVDDSSPYWRKETVSVAAAYGGERLSAHLYLPKQSAGPHRVVVYFPPSSALVIRSSASVNEREFSFLMRSGRAVLLPVYKGTFERRLPQGASYRGITTQWSKDLGRSLDYLETRSDVRMDGVGFHGLSLGAYAGLLFAAVEPRLTAVVLVAGGLSVDKNPGDADPLNFAPRIKAPVLLVAGREDFRNPLELSQKPLMRLLGSREKKHYVFEGGHVPPRQHEMIRVVLEWFDRFLGPV